MNNTNTNYLKPFEPKSFNNFWIFYTIGFGLGLLLLFIPFCGIFIGLPFMFAGAVFCYILLYRFWFLIQDSNPGITPGQAVGFSFIPFYNFYWIYVANVQLCKLFNKYCVEKSIVISPINVNFALVWYIIALANIPLSIIIYLVTFGFGFFLSIFIAMAAQVFHVLVFKQLSDASVKIIEHKSNA
jgi:hypothetical protein